MHDLLDWLLSNPIFFLLIAIGILGNIGGSAKRRRTRTPSPARRRPETIEQSPPEPPPVPKVQSEEEIARRIREMFGQPLEAEPALPPWLEQEEDAREPEWAVHEDEAEPATRSVFVETTDGHAGASMRELSHLPEQRHLPSKELARGSLEARTRQGVIPVAEASGFAAGMSPRQAFFAMLVLGPPRCVRSYDEDAAGLP
ncbi:MAG: hypothetical protein ACE5F1_02715 [Planctomycetota bacterium]